MADHDLSRYRIMASYVLNIYVHINIVVVVCQKNLQDPLF